MKRSALLLVMILMGGIQIGDAQWEQASAVGGGYVCSFAVSGSNLFAGTGPWQSYTGGAWLSTDAGATWNPAGLSGSTPEALAVMGTRVFAGIGNGGVYVSTNNGASWNSVSSGLAGFISSLAVSGTNLLAGSFSDVFLSTDNGASWNPAAGGYPAYNQANALAMIGTHLFAGSGTNGVYRSSNGANWVKVSTGLGNWSIYALAVIGSDLFAGDQGGHVFRSTNNGASWDSASTGLPGSAIRALAVSGTDLFAGTFGGGVFRSTDRGASWTQVSNAGLTSPALRSLAVSGGNLFAGTWGGGGIFRLSGVLPIQLASFSLKGRTLIWTTASEINNYGFEVQRSLDGRTFASIAGSFVPGNGTTNQSHSYSYVDPDPAGTTSYRLKQMDLDGAVNYSEPIRAAAMTSVKDQMPAVFALEQNYPNPFNPTTTIRFSVPRDGQVRLDVFDIGGEPVAHLVEGNVVAGIHELRFDGSKLSSGVYLYRLQAGAHVESKKFLLLR
jgi:hypothetical protein